MFVASSLTDAFDEFATGIESLDDLANAFIAAILSPEGQALLASYGFER